MADEAGSPDIYVFTAEAVRKAITTLTARPIHEHYVGYLALLRARRLNNSEDVAPREITAFHDRFLRGSNQARPYLSVFRSRSYGTLTNINANVAGSYAPSSLRGDRPFRRLVNIKGERQNATYSLVPDHADKALETMLGDKPVPLVALGVFLFREFGFAMEKPDIGIVFQTTGAELGITLKDGELPVTVSNDVSSFSSNDLVRL